LDHNGRGGVEGKKKKGTKPISIAFPERSGGKRKRIEWTLTF